MYYVVCTFACVGVRVHACGGLRLMVGLILYHSSTLFIEGASGKLSTQGYEQSCWQLAWEILLRIESQPDGYKHLAFLWVRGI